MRKFLTLLTFFVMTSLSTQAFAYHCPLDMAKIDAALAAGTSLSMGDMDEVKKLRAEGEKQHKAGDHDASVKTLAMAMKMLGLK